MLIKIDRSTIKKNPHAGMTDYHTEIARKMSGEIHFNGIYEQVPSLIGQEMQI